MKKEKEEINEKRKRGRRKRIILESVRIILKNEKIKWIINEEREWIRGIKGKYFSTLDPGAKQVKDWILFSFPFSQTTLEILQQADNKEVCWWMMIISSLNLRQGLRWIWGHSKEIKENVFNYLNFMFL